MQIVAYNKKIWFECSITRLIEHYFFYNKFISNNFLDIKDLIKSMLPLIMVIPRQIIIDNITYKINDNDEVFNIINNIYNEFKINQQKIYKFDKKLQKKLIFTKTSQNYHN